MVGLDEVDRIGWLWGGDLGVTVLAALDPAHVRSPSTAQVRAGRGHPGQQTH